MSSTKLAVALAALVLTTACDPDDILFCPDDCYLLQLSEDCSTGHCLATGHHSVTIPSGYLRGFENTNDFDLYWPLPWATFDGEVDLYDGYVMAPGETIDPALLGFSQEHPMWIGFDFYAAAVCEEDGAQVVCSSPQESLTVRIHYEQITPPSDTGEQGSR